MRKKEGGKQGRKKTGKNKWGVHGEEGGAQVAGASRSLDGRCVDVGEWVCGHTGQWGRSRAV